jgi:hypothetical protein
MSSTTVKVSKERCVDVEGGVFGKQALMEASNEDF